MIHLKRASAGSGKTYSLAKTYIKLLISLKHEDMKRRLRTPGELRSALPSIMAVTFTNKATAEMKQRIVEKLAALAVSDLPDAEGKIPAVKDVEYLEDFIKELNAPRERIAEICSLALRELLLHFSDFKVSTIDSFFQNVLHTFAYEANLTDSFNLEMDSDYVAAVGFDAALDTLAAGNSTDKELKYWLDKAMNSRFDSNQWNIYQRRDGQGSLYMNLISNANNLEKEEYLQKRREIEDFFENKDNNLREIEEKLENLNEADVKEAYRKRRLAAERLVADFAAAGLDPMAHGKKNLPGRLEKALTRYDLKKVKSSIFSANEKSPLNQKAPLPAPLSKETTEGLEDAYAAFLEANNELKNLLEKEKERINTWLLYKSVMPELVIVLEIARRKKEYLDSTNSFQISDTNSALSRIIGDDETPFIYERLGSTIDHYLIDEFQDTSRMQWDNFKPLLLESESRSRDNLIIGDAKQSIYRFRNADYHLIQTGVEESFKNVILSAEDEVKDHATENTNYRSEKVVVDFNNRLFTALTDRERQRVFAFPEIIDDIYRDCAQHIPPKKEKRNLGYVEVNLYNKPTGKKTDEEDEEGGADGLGIEELPERLLELRSRGYKWSDIGILVRAKRHADSIVAKLTTHNTEHPEASIPFISEDSLLVGSSLSVRLIIHALQLAAGGNPKKPKENNVLKEPIDYKELGELIGSLQSMSLPSMVDAIAERFLTDGLRASEAPYLAAFQDAVLDYSASHSSDIGSFLKWWQRKMKTLAITSPENAEGVRIVTIHKSKGLEYRVVIVPVADFAFKPDRTKSEWRWVEPASCVKGAELLPPYMPVPSVGKIVEDSAHADVAKNFLIEMALDSLNAMYVAFTRACSELYIYSPIPGNNSTSSASTLIADALGMKEEMHVSFGRPLTTEEIADTAKSEPDGVEVVLESYEVAKEERRLVFRSGDAAGTISSEEGEAADSDETDARSEGTLKHRILEGVNTVDDLERSVRSLRVRGHLTTQQAREWERSLREAIESVEQYGWFAPENRVVAERSFLQKGSKDRRPDRMVVRPDGTAVIIDYKFGKQAPAHKAQVARYIDSALRTGLFKNVEGYVWYLNEENRIVKVK